MNLSQKEKEWIDNHPNLSGRQIAKMLGRSKSTINYYRNKVRSKSTPEGCPKVLFLDIETSPILGSVWSLWNNNVGLNQIANDWFVLSWAAKWLHSDVVMYEDQRYAEDIEDDSDLLVGIWQLVHEADIVIGQNSRRFDMKKLNARFIINGFQPPSSYRQVDTLEIAKKHFAFTSNKLEYLSDTLCSEYKKQKHGKFPGFELWKECLKGNIEAFEEMETYNRYDVLALEELYFILSPWSNTLPNFNVYNPESLQTVCQCGSDNIKKVGFHYSNLGAYNKYRCGDCGREQRGKTNLLSKEKRDSLTTNIV